MAESTERKLYGDLRAITDWQKSKFLLYFDSSCIVITRSRKLARVMTSKSVVEISVLPTAAIMVTPCSMLLLCTLNPCTQTVTASINNTTFSTHSINAIKLNLRTQIWQWPCAIVELHPNRTKLLQFIHFETAIQC